MEIIHIDSRKCPVNVREFEDKLRSLGMNPGPFSSVSFCPHFICSVHPESGEAIVINTSDGYFDFLKKSASIVECSDADEFVGKAAVMKGGAKVVGTSKKSGSASNALF